MSTGTGARPVSRTGTGASRAPRAVFWTGIVLATAVAVTALRDGARPRIPGMPPFLGLVAGVAVMWLVVAGLGAGAAELLRRHHRALAAHAARHGKRGALAAARVAAHGSRAAAGRLAGRAAQRPPRRTGQVTADAGTPSPAGHPAPVPDPRLNDAQRQRDRNGQQNICAACGHPGTPGDPLVIDDGGYRIHGSHTTGRAGTPAPAVTPQNGEPTMSTPAPPSTSTKAASARANAPAGWEALAAATAYCEPEDDGELLGWMAGEVAGMSAYGEALIEVYETCVDSVGLDPVAMAAVHDVADAAADAATAMAYARQKFASHYAEVREFVGNGGVLPYDGRWIKGEGDT